MSKKASTNRPIAVYDSGVGGLSVLRALLIELPNEDFIYLGDQAHVPYGERSLEALRELADGVTRFFIQQGAKIIVIACNTASAAALKYLRAKYPEQIFVGMEPAVKPAAEQTHSHKVGVLATPSTFHGELYASVVERFANGVEIFQSTCPGLVAQIEQGNLDGEETMRILHDALDPMLEADVDKIVLACTHFPFVIPQIEAIVAGRATVIDPAPAVARQTARVLAQKDMLSTATKPGRIHFYTSGNPKNLQAITHKLIGLKASIHQVAWDDGNLHHHLK
jgi:glutamate racemase